MYNSSTSHVTEVLDSAHICMYVYVHMPLYKRVCVCVCFIFHMQFEYQQAQLELEIENLSWKVERAEQTDVAVSAILHPSISTAVNLWS